MIKRLRKGIVSVGNVFVGKQVMRKRGIETLEMAILVIVVLAVAVVFKDQLIDVLKDIMEFVKTTAKSMFG